MVAAVSSIALSPSAGPTVQAVEGGQLGAGGEYHPLTPIRIFDSRQADLDVAPGGPKSMAPLSESTTFEVPIAGLGGLPAFVDDDGDLVDDNVLAVTVNITVITPDQQGYLRAFGTGAPEGESSVVNFYSGEVVPNMAIVRPGENGMLSIRLVAPVQAGSADVAIDLFGWFSGSAYETRGARVVPAGPARIFDSRESDYGEQPLGAMSQIQIPIRGAVSYNPVIDPIVPDDPNVVGALLNITGVNALPDSLPTYLAILPEPVAAGTRPTTSNLNLMSGQVRSVMAIVPVGPDGSIQVFNRAGEVDVIVDVMGYLLGGADAETRAGRVVPLISPFRAFDTRATEHSNTPLSPSKAENWSFEEFVNDVRIGDELVGAQLGLLGNFTATELSPQYIGSPVSSFLTVSPPPGPGDPPVPTVSNITIAENQTMPNLTLMRYGLDADDPRCAAAHCVQVFNRAGYVHYLLDVSAVILADE